MTIPPTTAPTATPAVTTDTATALAARIDPWLAHMRWRPDFARWREQRIHQEQHQGEALRLLAAALATAPARTAPPADLLDLGCGMGGFAVAAAQRGFTVVALDYHPAYCAITAVRAEHHALRLPVAAAAGEHLPLPAAQFDLVTCLDVLEHVQQPAALLAELARVLRPDGRVLITAINRYALKDPHYHLWGINWLPRAWASAVIDLLGRRKGGQFKDRQTLGSMHYFTWDHLARLAAQSGFRVVDLDEARVAQGQLSPRRAWLRQLTRTRAGTILLGWLYRGYRTGVQGTWRLVLLRDAPPQ